MDELSPKILIMSVSLPFSSTILLLLASSISYFGYRLYKKRSLCRGLPGPPHSWLWGHLHIMGEIAATMPPNMHPQAYYTSIARKYGLEGVFYLDLWPIGPLFVVLTDPELADHVTVKKPLHQHPHAAEFLGPVVGENVIAVVNGPAWKNLHNAMAPAFSWGHIRRLTDVMVDECSHFRKTLEQSATNGNIFSMEETAAALIFDMIARAVFNTSLHAQTEGSQQLQDLKEMISLAENQLDIGIRFNPWLRLKLFFKRREVLGRLHLSISQKINERFDLLLREKIVTSRKDPNSILDLMLSQKIQSKMASSDATHVSELTTPEMQVLLDNVKGLLIGGQGTTVDTLCFIYMLLSKAPESLNKLRLECQKVFDERHDQTIEMLLQSPEKLQELSYMDAVVKETLRLFPVGFGVRIAEPGSTLEYLGRTLPTGNHMVVTVNVHDIHYNAKYFPEPTKFQPERWLDPEHPIPRSYFRTFGRGTRACLGQNLATNMLKVVLLMTISEYDFECADLKPNATPKTVWTDLDTVYGDIVLQEIGIEAKPRGGMMMRVRRRGAE